MLARLAKNPNDYTEISDENSAIALLNELLILEKFMQNPTPSKEWFSMIIYSDHGSHFIVAVKFDGFKNRIDNGHAIQCYPKSKFGRQDVQREVSRSYSSVVGSSDITQYWLPSPKAYN